MFREPDDLRNGPKPIAIIEDVPELCPTCEGQLDPQAWEIDAEEVEWQGKYRMIPIAINRCVHCGGLVVEPL